MKLIWSSLCMIGVTFIIASCQPELDDPNPNPPANSDGTVFWKYVELDTTLTPGLDTLELDFFEYDNQNRVVKRTEYVREDTSLSPSYPYKSETFYFYNANDTLPFKQITLMDDISTPNYHVRDTSYYSYQGGLVTYDSSRRYSAGPISSTYSSYVQAFTTSGNITQVHVKGYDLSNPSAPPTCISDETYAKIFLNGNIVSQHTTSTGCVTGSSDYQYQYDNKINPFYTNRIEIRYPIGKMFNASQGAQKNNLTDFATSFTHYHYNYTYRSDGYPLVMRGHIEESGGTDIYDYKAIYFYKD